MSTFTFERKLLFSYSLIYWSIHELNLFYLTNRICVCKSIKTTKLVQASTIACSSSAMLEQHGSTGSTRSTKSNVLSRVESSRTLSTAVKNSLLSSLLLLLSRSQRSSLCFPADPGESSPPNVFGDRLKIGPLYEE